MAPGSPFAEYDKLRTNYAKPLLERLLELLELLLSECDGILESERG